MALYNLRSNPSGELPFTITKFDNDLNPESVYSLGNSVCECPAGHLPKCRHRTMLPTLRERVDTAWFWNFENSAWVDPTGAAQINDEAEPLGSLEESIEGSEGEATPIEVEAEGHPRAHAQSLDGAIESGAVKITEAATKFNRRL